MKTNFTLKSTFILSAALVLISIFIPKSNKAQQLQMNNFVLFGGDGLRSGCTPPSSPGPGVILGGGSSVTCGSVGSYALIKSTGSVNVSGSIHSRGKIILSTNNIVSGKISAANNPISTGTILQVGNGSNLSNNIDVNGKIIIGTPGIVSDTVTHPAGTTYTGPVPGGNIIGLPMLPTLPVLPSITSFPPAGATNITNTQTISPGSYNNLNLAGNKTVTFSGPGVYVFNSIKNTGSPFNKFVFDFANNAVGNFYIYVHGDVNLNKLNVDIINGGGALRIYAETHGTGSTSSTGTYAWQQANGVNGNRKSEWFGTVWAPYAAINIGSSSSYCNITGALWSGTQVNIHNNVTITCAPFGGCIASADAGTDQQLTCSITTVQLNGSSSTSNAQYSWTPITGHILSGALTANPIVDEAGTYVLTVTNLSGGCTATDTAKVIFIPCIIPAIDPPLNGKTNDIIGSELNSLHDNASAGNAANTLYIISNDSVWIEVIALKGHYSALLALLQSPTYGMTDFIDNGPDTIIISGKYKISKLLLLNGLPSLIDYARPLYPPVSKVALVDSGATYTKGDISIEGDLARGGFDVNGIGIKIGVLSNSYNTILGDPAATDIANGDLPGTGNATYPTPVHILKEYPYGISTDEGRAMLQIVHDVAPGAELAFHSGFVSAGNFAQGIKQLQQDNCNVIVDDVTYITEPFFEDGVVAKAVDLVTSQGVSYFSAAGNFGNKSYQGVFDSAAPPAGITGAAHNFGGGDILQGISLIPGNYTVVLQWTDSIYSLGQTQSGTNNDLDIYLTNNAGAALFGFNRNNIGGDPLEVLSFTVTQNTTSNIMIIRAAGLTNVNFKYIVFRGELSISEHNSGTSTIVGQANAAGAMAVGASYYINTPAFGIAPPVIETYSSVGGTPVYGVNRNKPDFTAPDGVNTTVFMGVSNYLGDLFPNFFGTSAAAPHAAGTAALIMEAKDKFLNQGITPAEMRTLLQSTSVNMLTTGHDSASGSGLIQADAAIRTFASPKPVALNLVVPLGVTPGTQQFTVTVEGKYFTPQSVVIYRGSPITTTPISSTQVSAVIDTFIGNPPIQVYNPPITLNADGGYSDSIFFFNPIKQNITVTAENKTKKFGETIPAFTIAVLVDGQPLDSTGLTLADLGLDAVLYNTPANNLSNTGIYFIHPSREFDPSNPTDIGLLESYNYTFIDGFLSIDKMPLTIIARDTTITYGDKIDGLGFNYLYDDSLIDPAQMSAFLNSLEADHESQLADELVLVDARYDVGGRSLTDSDLANLSFLASSRSLTSARNLVSTPNLVNTFVFDTMRIVDVALENIFSFQVDSANGILANARNMTSSHTLVSARNLVSQNATVNARNLTSAPLVSSSGSAISSDANTVVVIDTTDFSAPPNDTLTDLKSIIMITGTTVGDWAIVPGAYLSNNFIVNYEKGTLHITKAPLTATARDTSRFYNTSNPDFSMSYSGFVYDDNKDSITEPIANTTADIFSASGNYPITLTGGAAANYYIVPVDGILTVIPNPCFIESNLNIQTNATIPIPVDVDDENLCTVDACDPVNGITHDPVLVDDGIACTTDACDPITGIITHIPEELSSITGPALQCIPALAGNATFSVAPLSGIATYNWTPPAGLVITSGQGTNTITVHWNTSFAHYGISGQLCVDAGNTCGNQQSCVRIDMNASQPVLPGSITGPPKLCPGDIATYSIISLSRATGYIWIVPSGINITSGQNTNSIEVEVVNGYAGGSVSVAGINVCGTGAARTKNISLNIPAAPVSIAGPASGLCNASGVMYAVGSIASPILAPAGSSYQWSVAGGTIVGSNTGALINIDWGSFTTGNVSVVEINTCGASASRTLNVTAAPAAPGAITGETQVCINTTYHYSISTVAGATSYLWTSPTGTIITGQGAEEVDVTYAGIAATNQSISIRAFNACGNSPLRLLNGISIDACSLRLADAAPESEFNVYPNPTDGDAQITFNANVDCYVKLDLMSVNGELLSTIMSENVKEGLTNTVEIKSNNLSGGLYLLRLTIGDNTMFKKLIIAK